MPPRKRPEQRQGRGTRDLQLTDSKLPKPAPPHPPNRKLLKVTCEAWDAFWEDDLASLVKRPDLPALGRLFRHYDRRERLERVVLKTPFTAGSTGQLVPHPGSGELAKLETAITGLEDRFGLTPAARLKLGIQLGQAARSLEDLNRDFEVDEEDESDPRLRVIDTQSREA